MTNSSERRARAIATLDDALEADTLDEKDYYVREALQLLKLDGRGATVTGERSTE